MLRDLQTIKDCKEMFLMANRQMTNWAIPKAKKTIEDALVKLDRWEKENGTKPKTD
jgi:hypothetical protein